MSGDQLEQRMSSFERRMIGLTKGGVLVAVITGTIFFGQAAIMWYQLHEMKAGSAETHDLVEASKNQARNLQSIANSTSANAEAARRFAGASEAHIRAMQAVSRLERRAWIGISDVKASKLEVGQPVLISVGFTNTGKTPAKKLTIVSNFAVARNGEKVDFRYSAEAASPPERNSRGLLTAGGDTHINFDTTRGRPASAYCIFTD